MTKHDVVTPLGAHGGRRQQQVATIGRTAYRAQEHTAAIPGRLGEDLLALAAVRVRVLRPLRSGLDPRLGQLDAGGDQRLLASLHLSEQLGRLLAQLVCPIDVLLAHAELLRGLVAGLRCT